MKLITKMSLRYSWIRKLRLKWLFKYRKKKVAIALNKLLNEELNK